MAPPQGVIVPPTILVILNGNEAHARGIRSGIHRYARETKLIRLIQVESDVEALGRVLKSEEFDGVIVQLSNTGFAALLKGEKYPVVNVSNLMQGLPYPKVVNDDRAVGRMAMEHFVEMGHQRVAFTGIPGHGYSDERLAGMRDAAAERGVEFAVLPPIDFGTGNGEWVADFLKELKKLDKPVGVLGCNDRRARRIAEWCLAVGLKIPEEVAIVGVDNDEMFWEFETPMLSSVALSSETVGYEAARTIKEMCEGKKVPARLSVAPRALMMRASSNLLAIDDEQIRETVEWARQNMREGLSVRDLAARASMSRRSLELRFRKAMGITPSEMLRQVQVSRAKQLLMTSELTIKQVAIQCGFAEPSQFYKAFKRATGRSPTLYRKKPEDMGKKNALK